MALPAPQKELLGHPGHGEQQAPSSGDAMGPFLPAAPLGLRDVLGVLVLVHAGLRPGALNKVCGTSCASGNCWPGSIRPGWWPLGDGPLRSLSSPIWQNSPISACKLWHFGCIAPLLKQTHHSEASKELTPQRRCKRRQEGDENQEKHLYLLVFSRKVN